MATSLAGFSVENYRAFARPQSIAIRPLTLFFGWNSGGKSALVRFLPLLAESVRVAGPPMWLAGEVGRGATWPELVCKSTQRGLLRFGLSWRDDSQLAAEWEIGGDLGGRWQETRSLSIVEAAGGANWSIKQPESGPDSWNTLAPPNNHPAATPLLARLRSELQTLSTQVQWVSGVRVRPPRLTTYGGGAPPTLRPDGGDSIDHLIAAQLRSTADPLLGATSEFFDALGETLTLDNPFEGAWRVRLHPAGASQGQVNLCDTGEGYAQVLPVLVALARAQLGGPRLLCVEQPELHLHTKAQAELAKVLVSAIRAPTRPQLLIETHSEVLLTSVQLAIAKGEIDHEMVRVYWVESRSGTSDAVPVDFDKQGRPASTAITGAFDEAIKLGQSLLAYQLKNQNA